MLPLSYNELPPPPRQVKVTKEESLWRQTARKLNSSGGFRDNLNLLIYKDIESSQAIKLLMDKDVESLEATRQITPRLSYSTPFRDTFELLEEEIAKLNEASLQAIRGEIMGEDDDAESLDGLLETENSENVDNSRGARRRNTGWSSQKANLGRIFVISNFVLEIPSAVFDQLSSVHKPHYALLSMLMSFAALLICIIELIYRVRNEKLTWRWRGTLPWLYYRSQSHKPFGDFKDIVGLVCALCQSIVTTINYNFCHRHADNPIKISIWPIIFAFGVLCSKFQRNPERI